MMKKRIQVKKKLALLLSSALLVTSMNVIPVKAAENNQATGSEVENAEASTKLSLEIASAPATDQMHTAHDSEWKNLNEDVTPDSNGTYQITEDGKYYLSADIQQTMNSNAVTITNNAKVTICLNGHTISTNSNIPITVDSGASLTIEDCSAPGSKTGTGSVTGNGQDVIRTYGNLVVNRVNVTNTGTGNAKYAINAGGSSYDVGSVVIKNSKLKANSGSLYAICVENITIESTECTGEFYVSKNNNMTISSSTVNEGNETAIYYTSGKGGTITITDSVLTTTSSSESDAGLMCWYSNGPITINIEGSTINAPENGIRVNNGETVKISNSKFICTNTDTPEWGYAISYEDVEEDSGNKLEVSDVEIKDWNTGIKICSDYSDNPEMNFTLSGNVKFEKKALLNTDIDFPTSGEGKVNLHFNDLTTRNMVINAYSGKMENLICDNDYSTYFIDSKYMFDSEQDGEKYVLNCTPRSITRQPTAENPQIAVNDASNVSYQWHSVESSENVVTDQTVESLDEQLGEYEEGVWKPQQYNPSNPEVPYAYYLVVKLNAGDLVILENPYGTLESMKDILDCFGSGTTEKEYKDGKLYFTIPSDGNYLIGADFVHADENWPINADTRLKITVKGTKVTGEVAGSTKANMVTPTPGTFCCKATWAKGTAFEYSVLSDAVTVTQPIAPSKYAVTVNGGTSASTEYAAGETVTITANTAPEGKEFDKWEVTSGGVTLTDASKSTTTFTMPESAVTVQATYKDVSEAPPESGGTTPDTDKILDKAQKIVTSKIIGNDFTVSNLTTDKDIKNAIKTALLSDDKTKTVASVITVTKEDASTQAAGQIAINVKLSLNDKNITFNLKKVINILEGKNITVTVKDGNDDTVSGATVKVMLGKTQKEVSTSATGGSYTFSNLPAGLYNVVVAKDGVTKTAIANITTNDATVLVKLDTSSVGSSLNVKDTTVPETAAKVEETVVNNLDALAEAEALKETDPAVSSYKVEMKVEAKADKQISKSTQNEMVKAANKDASAATDKATNIDFLDISIIKTITKSSGTTETKPIADTGDTVIEIIIPFNFTGKTNVKVLREHNGEVKKFEKIDTNETGAEGTYKIDKKNGLIILYAKYFSTYAVSYVAEGESAIVEPVAPTYPYPVYTGGGSVSVTVPATGITIEADKYEIIKEGETVAIKAAIQPSNATDTKLTFTSSDEKVAKVDANGVITAVGNGTATITIKTANDITKTITITVNIPSEENKDDGNKDDGNKDDGNKDDGNKDDGNKDDGNKEESSSPEKEVVTPEKLAANAIAISKGFKVSQKGTKINVSWGKVAGADGYLVYAAYCGTDIGKAVKTVKDPSSVSTTITKLNGKKLDLKKNFKFYVKAYKLVDGKMVAFGRSISAHIAGSKNPKYTNVKEIKLTSKSKLALAVGKTSKIKAKSVLVDSAKKQLSDSHTKEFRYASSNKKIAAVDKNGKITAKAKGTCYIYVYARNGYAKKVTVTVK